MKKLSFLILICAIVPTLALATKSTVTGEERSAVDSALSKLSKQAGRKITASDIQTTPVPGLLQVTSDLNVIYVSTNGKYILFGDLVDLNKDKKNWSLTEQESRLLRQTAIAAVDPKDFIVFPASGKKIGTVTVFFDVDCHFCDMLQSSIKDYTNAGIEMRYLAFPRSGPKTASFDKAISVWCAADPAQALTLAAQGKDVPKNACQTKAVQDGYDLGLKIGVAGTPTLILPNGSKIPGVVAAKDLAKMIKDNS